MVYKSFKICVSVFGNMKKVQTSNVENHFFSYYEAKKMLVLNLTPAVCFKWSWDRGMFTVVLHLLFF